MPSTIGVPNTFATQSGNVPASQLDDNFTAVAAQTGYGRTIRLLGNNNSGSPTTQYDLSCTAVVVWQASTGKTATLLGGNTTVNFSTAGPTANGRDQAGAFSATQYVHLYWIYNGTTLAAIASSSSTAPTLPTGYTHYAFATTVLVSGSAISPCYVRGSGVYYRSRVAALGGGTATVSTAIDLSPFIPPNALEAYLSCGPWQVTTDGSGVADGDGSLTLVSGGVAFLQSKGAFQGLANSQPVIVPENVGWVPNLGQQIFYINAVVTGSSPILIVRVLGFSVANGDA